MAKWLEHHLRAARRLGLIERLIGPFDQPRGMVGRAIAAALDRIAPVVFERGDPHAGGDMIGHARRRMGNRQFVQPGQHRAGQGHRAIARGLRQEDDEFLAPIAGKDIAGPPRHGRQRAGDLTQAFIARRVAILVVVGLEMVDIEQDQRERIGIAQGARGLGVERGLERAAVGHPGQSVGHRLVLKLAGHALEAQVGVDPRAQQPGARRLGDEVARPAFEPAHFDVLVAHRRHEDDRHRFEAHVLAQRPAQVEPASARHVHVEQDQLGNAQVDLELGLGGARGKPRAAEVFQLADDDPCCDRIVVYQKNVDIHENGLPALSAPEVRQFRPFPSCRGRLDCRRNACGPFMQHETESLPPTLQSMHVTPMALTYRHESLREIT
jgi:hypothetical protein